MNPTRRRFTASLTGVTSGGWTEGSLTVPIRGLIRRVRAVLDTGDATTVQVQVRESSGATAGLPVVLEYASTALPLDQEEGFGIWYDVSGGKNYGTATLYVAAKTDTLNGSNLTVEVTIEAGE